MTRVLDRSRMRRYGGAKESGPARRCFYRCLGCRREVAAVQDVRTQLHRLRCTACGERGFSYREEPI